ncbi:MAG TPA: DUF6458 family protein [Acidimicrobiales bacterium]|nr:DUF6458 family protein [Acidimicrobiales bacterium]
MGIGVSVLLMAVGAILAFAVDVSTEGLDLNAVGVILLLVGLVGLLASLFMWDRLGFGAGGSRRTVVHDRDVIGDEPGVVRRSGTVRERRVVEDSF